MSTKRRWTDDQLRAAVASAHGYVEVQEALGLHRGGAGYWSIRARIEALAIDTSHFRRADHVEILDDESRLRAAVASAMSLMQVLSNLGLTPAHGAYEKLRRKLRALGIDTSHFVRWATSRTKRRRWTDDQLRGAVASSRSIAQALRAIGLIAEGGNYRQVHRRIAELGLDTSHMTGMGWNRGGTTHRQPVPLREVLVADRWTNSHRLKQRLFRAGLKRPACERCGWAERSSDGRLPLELDHINGDPNDNRIENLRVLCPNCHALTPTYRSRNRHR